MHSNIHSNNQQHHHQAHLQMSFTSVSAAYAPHLQHSASNHQHHHPNFHHTTPIHHPQPMPFPPIVHHNGHHLPHPQRLDHNKLSAFEFPNSTNQQQQHQLTPTSEMYKNGIASTNLNNNIHHHNHSQMHHVEPPSISPSHTIKSSSSIEPSSEGMASPQLVVVDNVPNSPVSICNSSSNGTAENNNKINIISNGPSHQNGLLDILMNSDKCQVSLYMRVI